MRTLLSAITLLSASFANGATLFFGAYPNAVLVFDESKGQVVDRIPLTTGLPTSMRLSHDRKKIFVTTNDHGGVEIIDVASRKVISHFVLNTGNKRYRFNGGVPDPDDKFLYTLTTEMEKQVDRYEIGKPKYTIIDLVGQKIAKTVDVPAADENEAATGGGGRGGGGFEVSPDGKYLYQFGNKIQILSTADFKVLDTIDLEKPDLPGMEQVGFGGLLDNIREPNRRVSLFNFADPVVHNRVFGIAHFDLTNKQFDFTPIGPSPAGMTGLQVAPDLKNAYTVVSTGLHGNKRCEFWHFDLATNRIAQTAEVPCRSRFSFGMSGDGKKLYFFGAGFEIEVYDAATLKYERTWDLNNDVTMAGMIVE